LLPLIGAIRLDDEDEEDEVTVVPLVPVLFADDGPWLFRWLF
jgi:hypothetical protein